MAKAGPKANKKQIGFKVHAQPPQPSAFPTLTLFTDKNIVTEELPLLWQAEFGDILVAAGRKEYRLFIRSAELNLRLKGMSVKPGAVSFTHRLDKTDITIATSSTRKTKTGVSGGGEVEVKVPIFSFGKAKAKATADASRDTTDSLRVEGKQSFLLVSSLQSHRFRIGDEVDGDPRRTHGFLEGQYGSRHVKENAQPHLTTLALDAGSSAAKTVEATLSVRPSNIHVIPEGGYATDPGVKPDERTACMDAMKSALATLRLMKAADPTGSALTLARAKMTLTPATDDT